jgi:hypothetical protein
LSCEKTSTTTCHLQGRVEIARFNKLKRKQETKWPLPKDEKRSPIEPKEKKKTTSLQHMCCNLSGTSILSSFPVIFQQSSASQKSKQSCKAHFHIQIRMVLQPRDVKQPPEDSNSVRIT